MSRLASVVHDLSHIPCPVATADQSHFAPGLASVNVDGRSVAGGIAVNGRCHLISHHTAAGAHTSANPEQSIVYMGGHVQRYTSGNGVARDVTSVRLARAHHL